MAAFDLTKIAQPFPRPLRLLLLRSHRTGEGTAIHMTQLEKNAVWQGTLSLMVLRTLLTMGEQHGYGIARRIEQTSEGKLSINYGTLYPALLKLEQEGLIRSEWGVSDNNRKAKFSSSPGPAGNRSSAIRGNGR